jgi:hypothetical protein
MKCLRVPKTVIIGIICWIVLSVFHDISFIETVQTAQPNTFDATISSDQDDYYMYEEIIATFNFSSHVTQEDYFAYAISENLSFTPIFQSDPVQGNFSVSEVYIFSLLSLNYSFTRQNITLYLLLYYFDDILGNNLCCSKSITIHKAVLKCEFPENFTQIEENTRYYLTFRLYDSINSQIVLQEEEVLCRILFDNEIYDTFTLLTTSDGYLNFHVEARKKTKMCEIQLLCNSSVCFNTAQFSFQLPILRTKSSSTQIVTTLIIIFSMGIACSCFVYFSIKIYKKKLKRNYSIRDIKI